MYLYVFFACIESRIGSQKWADHGSNSPTEDQDIHTGTEM